MNLGRLKTTAAATMVGAAAVAGFAPKANAGIYIESGDAGQTMATAAIPTGMGSLNTILGSHSTAIDVDVFKIQITDVANFWIRQENVGGDGVLYLFNEQGYGVVTNNDFGGFPESRPTITNELVTTPGIYYVAYTIGPLAPLDSSGLRLWDFWGSPDTQRAPDGPGANSPWAGWTTDSVFGPQGNYELQLNGVSFVPAPGPVALLGIAGLAMAGRRRSR